MDDIAEIKKKLIPYHSNFAAKKYIKRKTKLEIEQTIRKIEEDCNKDLTNGIERKRAQNLISYLYFSNGDVEKALDLNTKVQNEDPTNMVALCNKAWILYGRKQYSECQMVIETLAQHNKNSFSRLTSKAEVAYSYSRLGMHAYEEAIKIFDEINKESQTFGKTDELQQEIDSDQQSATNAEMLLASEKHVIPKDNVCIWTFGLALIISRRLHLHCHDETSKIDISKQQYARVLQLFYEVVSMQEKTALINKYKGRAYVEIGHVVYEIETYTCKVFPEGVKSIVPDNSMLHNISDVFYKLGLEIGPNDPFILHRCGVYYRHMNRIEDSIAFLKKSLCIKKSSYAYHHLGLSLQRHLILEISKSEYSNSNELTEKGFEGCSIQPLNTESEPQMSASNDDKPKHVSNLIVKEHKIVWNTVMTKKPQSELSDTSTVVNYCPSHSKFQLQKHFENSDLTKNRKTSVTNFAKCPRQPEYIKEAECKETVRSIFEYFDKAVELNENNDGAHYDKGLMYRQLKQNKEALGIFRTLIGNIEERQRSRLLLANAYEQAAFCCLDLMDTMDEVEVLKTDARIYLKIAIEITCDLIAKIPCLDNRCNELTTFSRTFIEATKSKQVLEDWHFLHQKLGHIEDDIDILKKLKALANEKEQVQISLKIVENYILIKNYDEAVYALDIMNCYGSFVMDRNLYLTAYIEGGIAAYKREQKVLAALRFRKALMFENPSENEQFNIRKDAENSEYKKQFDVHVLCQTEAEEIGRSLVALLEDIGLSATLNEDSILPGNAIFTEISNIIKSSAHFIFLFDQSMTDELSLGTMKYAATIIKRNKYGNILVVKTMPNVKIPRLFDRTCTSIDFFEIKSETSNDNKSDIILQKLKEILLRLASSNARNEQ